MHGVDDLQWNALHGRAQVLCPHVRVRPVLTQGHTVAHAAATGTCMCMPARCVRHRLPLHTRLVRVEAVKRRGPSHELPQHRAKRPHLQQGKGKRQALLALQLELRQQTRSIVAACTHCPCRPPDGTTSRHHHSGRRCSHQRAGHLARRPALPVPATCGKYNRFGALGIH